MKAAVFERYGGAEVVRVAERPDPVPKPDEILIRVVATTVSSADWRLRSLSVPRGFGPVVRLFMGITRPRKQILGVELAGRVEAIGASVSRFSPGDEVVAFPGSGLGAHAELIALPESSPIVSRPAALDWDHAAALCFGGTAAVDFLLNKGALRGGESVLVNGASGTVGSAAIQIARHAGAEVTAVCGPDGVAQARALGAHRVIDYREQDFSTQGDRWDLILDAVGNAPWSRASACLRPGGRLLMVVATMEETLKAVFPWRTKGRRCVAGTAREHLDDVALLARLADEGAYRPAIDTVFPLDRIVDAHRRLDNGRKHGSLVIRMPAAGH